MTVGAELLEKGGREEQVLDARGMGLGPCCVSPERRNELRRLC